MDIGGLENGLVNLINAMPDDRYLHAIICLTEYTSFRLRLLRSNVELIALNKGQGKDLGVYVRLWHLLRRLQPDIVHTRNFASLECQLPAWLAGVQHRIHSEHGWDIHDLHGQNRKYRLLRKLYRPLVDRYIPLSRQIENYLVNRVRVPASRTTQIYNGVDTKRFRPDNQVKDEILPAGFKESGNLIIGTVGRMHAVKDQATLVHAFLLLLRTVPYARDKLRLVVVGDGPLRKQLSDLTKKGGAEGQVWLAGERNDVPELLRTMSLFVLPSLAEGISNTILEAMATELPIVATRVGGTPELVEEGKTGILVPPANPESMALAIKRYIDSPDLLKAHSRAGRERVIKHFSLQSMVNAYLSVYDDILANK
jgi:sugar transferase (PEP-CTERM/EpsH1 system associated)